MSSQVDTLVDIALAEVGYLEKRTNAQLDDKTANAGSGNFTKYARDLIANREIAPNPYSQGTSWCDMFVDWCFIQAFGVGEAKRLLLGWSAYTPTSAGYFQKAGQWYDEPQTGDIIFFKDDKRICHTGIVYKVDLSYVYTIEGNTATGVAVIPNGGGVCKKFYSRKNERIAGYGRPLYKEDEMTYEDFKTYMTRYEAEKAAQEPNPYLAMSEYSEAKNAGLTDGSRPLAYATRQEVAVMAYRVLKNAKG